METERSAERLETSQCAAHARGCEEAMRRSEMECERLRAAHEELVKAKARAEADYERAASVAAASAAEAKAERCVEPNPLICPRPLHTPGRRNGRGCPLRAHTLECHQRTLTNESL